MTCCKPDGRTLPSVLRYAASLWLSCSCGLDHAAVAVRHCAHRPELPPSLTVGLLMRSCAFGFVCMHLKVAHTFSRCRSHCTQSPVHSESSKKPGKSIRGMSPGTASDLLLAACYPRHHLQDNQVGRTGSIKQRMLRPAAKCKFSQLNLPSSSLGYTVARLSVSFSRTRLLNFCPLPPPSRTITQATSASIFTP